MVSCAAVDHPFTVESSRILHGLANKCLKFRFYCSIRLAVRLVLLARVFGIGAVTFEVTGLLASPAFHLRHVPLLLLLLFSCLLPLSALVPPLSRQCVSVPVGSFRGFVPLLVLNLAVPEPFELNPGLSVFVQCCIRVFPLL